MISIPTWLCVLFLAFSVLGVLAIAFVAWIIALMIAGEASAACAKRRYKVAQAEAAATEIKDALIEVDRLLKGQI